MGAAAGLSALGAAAGAAGAAAFLAGAAAFFSSSIVRSASGARAAKSISTSSSCFVMGATSAAEPPPVIRSTNAFASLMDSGWRMIMMLEPAMK